MEEGFIYLSHANVLLGYDSFSCQSSSLSSSSYRLFQRYWSGRWRWMLLLQYFLLFFFSWIVCVSLTFASKTQLYIKEEALSCDNNLFMAC